MSVIPSQFKVSPELKAAVAAKADSARRLLADVARDFSPVAFANSLGAEDMVLTDLIRQDQLPITIFSLDTGRLPAETYDLMAAVEERYGFHLETRASTAFTVPWNCARPAATPARWSP